MKKIHVAMVCVLAGVSIMMTGCKKEEGEIVTLGAEIADGIGDGKVYLDGDGYPSWESSDHLWVNGDEKTLSNITGTRAKVEDVESAENYVAVYPYDAGVSRAGTSVTVNIPRAQTFERTGTNQKIVAPMVAYAERTIVSNTERTTLLFRNVCSLVKVTVTNNSGLPLYVRRIAINSSTRITGNATTTATQGSVTAPTLSSDNNSFYDAVLQFEGEGENIPTGQTKYYYVIVAPLSSANLTVTAYLTYKDNSNVKHDMHRGVKYTSVSLAQSKIAPVTLTVLEIDPENPGNSDNPYIDGHYTVNNTGKQVRFSRGNLQYRKGVTNNIPYEDWRLAINQYDFVGGNSNSTYGNVTTASGSTACHNVIYPGDNSFTRGNWIDLFAWGTGDNPTRCLASDNYSSFTDWGTNNINYYNNRIGRLTPTNITWRTLSQAEWDYLFNSRITSTINNVENARFAKVQVTGIPSVYTGSATSVYGILLFPDVFTWPSSITTMPESINNANASFDSYTLAQFKVLQLEGAVFLPFAGYRTSNPNGQTVTDPNKPGGNSVYPFNYWSSTISEHTVSDHPEYSFAKATRYYGVNSSNILNTNANYRRFFGSSVRLVQDVQ